MTERYVTGSELARELSVSLRTIERWRQAGMPSVLFGPKRGTRRYPLDSCLRWAKAAGRP